MIQSKGEINILTFIDQDKRPWKYLCRKYKLLYFGSKILNVFNFGQKFVQNQQLPKVLVINVEDKIKVSEGVKITFQ